MRKSQPTALNRFFSITDKLALGKPSASCAVGTFVSSNSLSKLDVLRHYSYTFGVNCAKVSVLDNSNNIGLCCLLQGEDRRLLKTNISLIVLRYLTNEALERKLAEEQLCSSLEFADFTKGDSARPVAMGLLHTAYLLSFLRAAFVAICLRAALPPVDLRAVCLVRAIVKGCS